MNRVILIGHLGQDPDLRRMPDGKAFATVTLATNRGKRDGVELPPDWHNLVFYGRQAEVLCEFSRKGHRIAIEGRIHLRSWEDRETGQKKYRTEIACHVLEFLSPKSASNAGDPPPDAAPPPSDGDDEPDQPF